MVNHIRQKRQTRPKKKSPKKVIKKTKSKKGARKLPNKTRKSPSKKKKGSKKKGVKKTGGSGVRQNINSEAYNKCWCVDLAVQKALKTCVEDLLEDLRKQN